jgi:hypothetical protein
VAGSDERPLDVVAAVRIGFEQECTHGQSVRRDRPTKQGQRSRSARTAAPAAAQGTHVNVFA